MTREEFLQRLSETPRTWRVSDGVMIRNDHCACPATALVAPDMPSEELSEAVSLLELDEEFVDLLIAAADYEAPRDGNPATATLRADLLRACGLA